MSTVIRGDRCVCRGCGELFNSTAAFTMHRTGDYAPITKPDTRRCRTSAEMQAKGMAVNSAGLWVTTAREQFTSVA